MHTTWPVNRSRYKGAEIFKDATSIEDSVNCPYCDELQDAYRVGLQDCVECGKTFETFLKDVD